MKWRWDQGRLNYFQFENLKSIAHVLSRLKGVIINNKEYDPLRNELELVTGLPFAPNNYRVWRNYKRVFEVSFLATNINGQLYVTDFCKALSPDSDKQIDCDEFLSLFISRFRFPFPAFDDYNTNDSVVYPFCAILKFLISTFIFKNKNFITLDQIFTYVVGNNCTGFETLDYYARIIKTNFKPDKNENRQVREMLIFLSQMTFLKWIDNRLYIDVTKIDLETYNFFDNITSPVFNIQKTIREEEFISISSIEESEIPKLLIQSRQSPEDETFIEGKRNRIIHIKIERSPLLRKLYLEKNPDALCDMCIEDMQKKYPWTTNILEIHHILPLSSSLTVTREGTSLTDVVGICPNCHRSVHNYYKLWLDKYGLNDFRNREEAVEIYYEAKKKLYAN